MAAEFCLKCPDFHVAFRDLLHAANLRHGTNGFTSLPKEVVLRIFFALEDPTASAGLNPQTWVLKGQYATSRPPKPLYRDFLITLYICPYRSLWVFWKNSSLLWCIKNEAVPVSMTLLQTHAHRNTMVTSNYLFFVWKENIFYSTRMKVSQRQSFPHLTFALTCRFSKLVYNSLQHSCLLILL
jgi:hypothetical protein